MEQELIVLADEAGNEYKMNIIQRFDHNGETFVVMLELHECGEGGCQSCSGCHDEGSAVYVMKEESEADGKKVYAQVEPEKIDEVAKIVRHIFGMDDESGCGCDCEDCTEEHCH